MHTRADGRETWVRPRGTDAFVHVRVPPGLERATGLLWALERERRFEREQQQEREQQRERERERERERARERERLRRARERERERHDVVVPRRQDGRERRRRGDVVVLVVGPRELERLAHRVRS